MKKRLTAFCAMKKGNQARVAEYLNYHQTSISRMVKADVPWFIHYSKDGIEKVTEESCREIMPK